MVVITPSGGRSESLELLNKYLERQTDQDFTWIILDDVEPHGHMPSRCDEYIVADWTWDGESTQARSMIRLLQDVEGSVVVCEDDDWYSPFHIATMRELLKKNDVVGQRNSVYYNIKNRTYKNFVKNDHSCMFQTGFKGEAIDHMRKVCKANGTKIDIDVVFWRTWTGSKHLTNKMTAVGIKGMPGRNGLGMGHKMHETPDYYGEKLAVLIGDDKNNYL